MMRDSILYIYKNRLTLRSLDVAHIQSSDCETTLKMLPPYGKYHRFHAMVLKRSVCVQLPESTVCDSGYLLCKSLSTTTSSNSKMTVTVIHWKAVTKTFLYHLQLQVTSLHTCHRSLHRVA